jgi:hypothetical protein
MSPGKIIILLNPFDPSFKKARTSLNYRSAVFQQALHVPGAGAKIYELKKIRHFTLCIIHPVMEHYVNLLAERNIYRDIVYHLKRILQGKKSNAGVDIVLGIPGFLSFVLRSGALSVYDSKPGAWRTHIDYFEEGRHPAPGVGRGEIIYQLDGIEIARTTSWIS